MKKSTWNLIIDLFMLLCMAFIAGIGFLIKYSLISGQQRWTKYNQNVELYLFGLDRHEWGTIHVVVGYILIGLLILHIILHWKGFICIFNRLLHKTVKNIFAFIFTFTLVLLISFPFLINPTIKVIEQSKGRNATNHQSVIANQTVKHKTQNINNVPELHHPDPSIKVQGFMTLQTVSNKYNVPAHYLKNYLNLPNTISNNQKLGHLRRKYNFEMSQIEKIILEYKKINTK